MRRILLGLFMIGAGFGGAAIVSATTAQLDGSTAVNFNRACRYALSDNIQVTAAPTVSTASTGLQGYTRYRVFCAQATYFDQAPTGGTDAATSADAQIAANTSVDVWTKQGDYIAFRAVAATGTCDILECQ